MFRIAVLAMLFVCSVQTGAFGENDQSTWRMVYTRSPRASRQEMDG